jgi:L-aminopeptidase/D-esterase-like protein
VIWELDGIEVGHWSDATARTGCTVVLCDPPAVASGEVRGSSPATREFSLLDPLARVERIDAVVLSGGSAFGLAAADGVMAWCEERGRGVPTSAGPVPIVVGLSLYDLAVGDPSVRPGPREGRAACDDAPSTRLGRVGAGTGASIGAWRGPDRRVPGALVGALERSGDLAVGALLALNPWGDVAGHAAAGEPPPTFDEHGPLHDPLANTVIGVVATNAALDKLGCQHLARAAHDGLARAVDPPHATPDGDAVVALSSGAHPAAIDEVRLLAVRAVERAIRSVGVHR